MKATAKITQIGNSKGVRIKSEDLESLGVDVGDEVEIYVTSKKHTDSVSDTSDEILARYSEAFKNLADR